MEQGFPLYRKNKFEDVLIYHRPDGQRMEVVFMHLPGAEPALQASVYKEGQLEPVAEGPELSLEEVRYRYKFYKQLAESGQLGQTL